MKRMIFLLLITTLLTTAGTWSTNNFFYKPKMGARGQTEKQIFESGLQLVDSHLGKYKTLGDPGYATLSEALDTIGTDNITLHIPAGTVEVADNLSIPANVHLRVFKGGQFNVASTKTLTINGPIEAGAYQIFSGAGSVALAGVSKIYDVWFASPPALAEGSVTAPVGSLFIKTSGTAPLIYVKESGTGNTGWAALAESSSSESNAYWGSITGTLSNQSDLQSTLDSKVPATRSINGHALSADVNLTKSDVGLNNVPNIDATNPENISQTASHRFVTDAEKNTWSGKQDALGFTPVPDTRTVNGHALSSNVTVTKSDINLSNVTDDAQLKRAAGDLNSFAEKVSPVSSDILLIEDSGAGYAKKKVQLSNLPGGSGTDSNAIHSDASAEINTIAEKVSPASADLLLIEDSGSGYAKKKVQVANLPGASGGETGLKVLGQRYYSTLSEAKSTIGNNHVTLIVPAGTYNISSDPSYPSNIELLVLKGATFNISNNVTMTIMGPFRAGNNRHFTFGGSNAKVHFNRDTELNAVWFTNGGDGSHGSGWTGAEGMGGVGEAIAHHYYADQEDGVKIFMPGGRYNITNTINCNRYGIFIRGAVENANNRKSSVRIFFTPGVAKRLFHFKNTVGSGTLYMGGISGIAIFGDNTYENVMIEVDSISFGAFTDIHIRSNNVGTGLYVRGHEMTKFERMSIDSATPILIGQASYTVIDCDAMIFRDLQLISREYGTDSACVKVEAGVEYMTSVSFEGYQGWLIAKHGFYWDDPNGGVESGNLMFRNVKIENAYVSDPQGYAFYINTAKRVRNLLIENMTNSESEGGCIYLRNVDNARIHNIKYFAPAGDIFDAADIQNLVISNIWSSRPIGSLTGMYKALAVEAGGYEKIAFAVYTDSVPTVTVYGK